MPSSDRLTTWLITGASRGIGLELVRHLLRSPANLVVAACRDPSKAVALKSLENISKGKLHIFRLDVADFDAIRASAEDLAAIVGESGLDYLVNNAGVILAYDTAFTMDPETLLQTVRTNTAGPAVVSQAYLPFIEKSERKTIVHISSTVGSVGSVDSIGVKLGSYALSKAALNMLTAKQQAERPDLTVICMCPGWVKTDLGGDEAQIEATDSIAGILKVVASLTPADSGRYLRWNGEIIPW